MWVMVFFTLAGSITLNFSLVLEQQRLAQERAIQLQMVKITQTKVKVTTPTHYEPLAVSLFKGKGLCNQSQSLKCYLEQYTETLDSD